MTSINKQEKFESLEYPLANELVQMAEMLNADAQRAVYCGTGILDPDSYFTGISRKLVLDNLESQKEHSPIPKGFMFVCPRVDVRDMSSPSKLFPTSISIDSSNGNRAEIFASRLPRLFHMFDYLRKQDANFELVLVIGDSDFSPEFGYQYKAIEFALANGAEMGEFNLAIFEKRLKEYKKYLVELLRQNAALLSTGLFEVCEDADTTYLGRRVRVLSFHELYRSGLVPQSQDLNFDEQLLVQEADSKYHHFREAWKKYDTRFFGKIELEQVLEVTRLKFRSYRDQGLFVAQNGGLLISDELPPVVKASMYRNNLLMVWPWIRSEDPYRNPDIVYERPFKLNLFEPVIES